MPVAGLLAPATASGGQSGQARGPGETAELTDWLTDTLIGDEEIDYLDRAALELAESHVLEVPRVVLTRARQLQAATQSLLKVGKLRHRQVRELLRINGGLLAHISLLLSDLGCYGAAGEFGRVALAFQREAGVSESTAWYVLAKAARWQGEYAEGCGPGEARAGDRQPGCDGGSARLL